jgi:hypothetical protein
MERTVSICPHRTILTTAPPATTGTGRTRSPLPATARRLSAVARGLAWTRRERKLGDLDPVNRMMAVLETDAHLDLLVECGELTCDDTDGLRIFTPTR